MMDFRENLQKCREYIQALDEEKAKIQVFQRELPLCLDLVTQAIEACKQQLSGKSTAECLNGLSECSEQTTSNKPVLEEFIPLKRSNSTDDDDDDDHEELESNKEETNNAQNNYDANNISDNDKSGKKSDWLRSVQLWNQTPDPPTTQEENQPKIVSVMEVKKNGCAFHPFQKEKSTSSNVKKPTSAPEDSVCSSGDGGGGGGGKKEEKGGQSQRKSRRCWSPELHKRFLHALQQLGGSHVATPKQIRELMKVDGLTNDEVKSHLQKYRLHTRRPSPANHNTTNTTQAPQFVVVGGIWMPSPEYTSVAAAATTTTMTTSGDTNTTGVSGPNNSIYKPVAAMATTVVTQRQQQKNCSQSHCEERGSHISTSSSTHTSTASHAF